MVKLNLGCGHKHFPKEEGWINVDYADNSAKKMPDVVADLRKLPFPYDYADEIHAIHALEHLYLWDAQEVLNYEWKRVLKPGGLLVIEVPCLNKILQLFKIPDLHPSATMWGLYGDPRFKDPNMTHRWCYSREMLELMLTDYGYKDIQCLTPQYHVKERDMRIEAKKAGVTADDISKKGEV